MSSNTIDKTKIDNTDVLIIGGGGSGLMAAVVGAEAGAGNITILEKADIPGGNAAIAGGVFAAGSPAQRRMGYDVSPDKIFKDKMEEAEWKIDPRLIRNFTNKSGFIIQWLEDRGVRCGHIAAPTMSPTAKEEVPPVFHLFQTSTVAGFEETAWGPKIVEMLVKECNRLGINILYETPADKILTDSNGEVTRVTAKTKDQNLTINAKCVIIATGGFAGSKEMIEKYFPGHGEIFSNSLTQMTGDGLIMAEAAGAMADNQIGIALIGPHHYPWSMGLTILIRRPHSMLVNKNGERYIDESTSCGGNNALSRQPGIVCYALLDSAVIQDMIRNKESLSSAEMEQGENGLWLDTLESGLAKDAAEGHSKIADTLDEIAEYIGAKPEVLKASVARYNDFCDNGYDEDFLKDKQYLLPVRTPPYYAILGRQGTDTTLGGVKINERMEVIGKKGDPISGLYGVGDIAGGSLSIAYKYPGSALAFALYSGYIAGQNTAEYILRKKS